jgi:Ser-tRNA(Ala) deacylase AlaX
MTQRVYAQDPYLSEFETRITMVTPGALVLEKTIFYPLGGGQASDTGTIEKDGIAYKVTGVASDKGALLHHVEGGTGPFAVGDTVRLTLDWDARYAMMKYHTALHILSQAAHSLYGAATTGNDISPERARIDMSFEELTPEMVASLESETNRHIASGADVVVETFPREEAERMVNPEKTRLELIPASITSIRLVRVGDIDTDACGGTHVRNTREIGGIKIVGTKNKGKNRKRMEIRLVESL